MKKVITGVFIAVSLMACKNTGKTVAESSKEQGITEVSLEDAPKVTVEKAIYDFGTIKTGEKIHYDFKFKNTGKTPLIISSASATCGCTVPEYPKDPVKPGEEAIIKVIFDSHGKMGKQDKVVTIISNAQPAFEALHLVGEVTENK